MTKKENEQKQEQATINKLRIALCLSGIVIDNKTTDLILHVQKGVGMLGSDFSIKDAVAISIAIEKKYAPKPKTKK